ncbi:hypothetical protein [Gordonia phthalatica]|uniref:hypothetical protein n=1 Tax=Gordonia phthalatica TaxID=1136941 RepID=UPI000B1EE534|nr:hypothetical protein [Gordonia phthalatica]
MITVSEVPTDALDEAIRRCLEFASVPDAYGTGVHLETPDGVRIYVHRGVRAMAVSLVSGLPDAEHNEWAIRIFDEIVRGVTGGVELLDEDDNVVRSRPPRTRASA